ncbi:hypothetical protein VF21_10048 [Pseudogymnoascus sp. 05NY08]|nr:hypothetical protein VF21_10048 [Pseudogymnoascus sp. 05NY08]
MGNIGSTIPGAAEVAATLISQQLDAPSYRPRRRKHAPGVSNASNSALTTATDDTVAGTQSPGYGALRICGSPSPLSRNEGRK